MSFVPGAAAPSVISARPRWFLVHRAGLVVRVDSSNDTPDDSSGQSAATATTARSELDAGSVALPELSDVLDLGLDPKLAQYVGSIDGEDCFTLHVDDLPVPEPWSVQGLRSLFGAL